jgi:SAM-dependent methyltransferase
MDSKKRFSNRVGFYVRYRPTYPQALLAHLEAAGVLPPGAAIADIGSGTGLSARLFLAGGYRVYGVEPNAEMREASREFLAAYPQYEAVAGSAEATTLPDDSIDLVTAGQAFHWFEVDTFRQEVGRILRPGGQVALFWNDRPATKTPFLTAYEQLLKQYAHNYAMVQHRHGKEEKLAIFFGSAGYQTVDFDNILTYDREALIGRALSSSYSPLEDDPKHPLFIQALNAIFERYEKAGVVAMPYQTTVYWGPLGA